MNETHTPACRAHKAGTIHYLGEVPRCICQPSQWRKKPITIWAIEWTGHNLREVIAFTGLHESARKWSWEEYEAVVAREGLKIFTLEGPLKASVGDFIIRGVRGEFYAIKPDILAETYEKPATALSQPAVATREPDVLNAMAAQIHEGNRKWWYRADGERLHRNKGELLMLVVTEVAEAMEGERKNLMDDKLPHRRMAEVEIVDAIVRLLDYAAGFGYDLDGALREKLAYNANREDHKREAERIASGTDAFAATPPAPSSSGGAS